jgi:Tfp pilus assembly protein PilV
METIKMLSSSRRRTKGFGLIEILITLGVLSIGILGVTVLNSVITKQSADNRARAEALAIAQSRIEEMRNYTDTVKSLAEFNTLFANTTGFGNSTSITGVATTFTRTESITASGLFKLVAVNVAWADLEGITQNAQLNTRLAYTAPRSIGDTALQASAAIVDAPTGRARLGEGSLPENANTTDNGDGTSLYQDGGTDLMLVADDQIVLTLSQACQTEDGSCIDFVKIKGRIWIDQISRSNLSPANVFIVASDAAFCARHYTVNGTTTKVTSATTNTVLTSSGNYKYFDYTCYIGGGWHGNIGVLLAGGLGNADKICVGDPVSVDAWAAPVIASRRVYRGMLYRPDANSTTYIAGVNSPVQSYTAASGDVLPRFYSQGIGDSVELPVPNSGQKTHDFVIGSFQQGLTAGSNCISQGVMVRADATISGQAGALFAGLPNDFICLNGGYLDNYDTSIYGNASSCPYNPADPPSIRHLVSGSISVQAVSNAANLTLMAGVYAVTSDGPGNCLTGTFSHNGTHYVANYQCDVYDWGNGWNGYIEAKYDSSAMRCNPNRLSFTTSADTNNRNFTSCSPGTYAVISGTVSASGNRRLLTATLSGGSCTVDTNGLSYECISPEFATTWSGDIVFTRNSGTICTLPVRGTLNLTNLATGFHTRNLTIANNNSGCP